MKKFLILFIIYIVLTNKSFALIEIDITRGNLDPLPIAVSPLHVDIKSEDSDGMKTKELGENISKIIENNFKGTGLFNPLKKDAFTYVYSKTKCFIFLKFTRIKVGGPTFEQ